jgi:hypothetical protein
MFSIGTRAQRRDGKRGTVVALDGGWVTIAWDSGESTQELAAAMKLVGA